jgi:SNF2 family DNA or RNA helicase
MLEYNRAVCELCGELQKPHQEYGVKWMLYHEIKREFPYKGGFLCDEMGLGKTIQTISVILGNPVKRTLIVVPKTIVEQWVNEFYKFAPQLKICVYDKHKPIPECDVLISSYSSVLKRGEKKDFKTGIHQIHWDRLVLDEAHEIRNRQTKLYFSLNSLNTDIRWLLTGTPVFNSTEDFISLLMFIGFSKIIIQTSYEKLKELYILRRTKDCISLPTCVFDNVELDMYEEERLFYQDVFKESKEFIKNVFRNTTNINMKNMELLECLLRARQCMIWPQLYLNGISKKYEIERTTWTGKSKKMETLLNMVKEHPDEKTLIFCQFVDEMNHIQEMLSDYDIFRLDGSTNKHLREETIKMFKKSQKKSIFIIQIKSGGQGLNLQEATRVYIMAPSWNPATELQAIGRSHRSGQTKNVFVKKLYYKGYDDFPSVEESIMKLQGHKSILCSEVLNDKRIENQIPVKGISAKVSINDIRKIFCV